MFRLAELHWKTLDEDFSTWAHPVEYTKYNLVKGRGFKAHMHSARHGFLASLNLPVRRGVENILASGP